MQAIDISGKRFGRLIALKHVAHSIQGKHRMWLFKCDCGKIRLAKQYHARSGMIKSCGCLRKEILKIFAGRKGPDAHNWKGGRKQRDDGYVLILKKDHPNARKNGYIAEHRYIMSKYLGRPLKNNEIVHHRNGVRHDNRIENLQLKVERQHKNGQTVDDMINFCVDFLIDYAPHLLKKNAYRGQLNLLEIYK